MKFCQSMLNETVGLLKGEQLKYRDSILIGENAVGKSEALKGFIEESERVLYFIDAVNRCFDVKAVKPLGEEVIYKEEIVRTRIMGQRRNVLNSSIYNLKKSYKFCCVSVLELDLLFIFLKRRK